MQSVPRLILVLCCMASAHRAIHNMAIHHLEARQDCSTSLPDDRCIEAYNNFVNSYDPTTALLDGFCEEACVGQLDDYSECLNGEAGYVDVLCVKQNNEYCYIPYVDQLTTCDDCNGTCTDTCRSCLSDYVDDLSCCYDQYRSYSTSIVNVTALEDFGCGHDYTCSGGAIAVPTVLTALLLMVMAAIVMWRTWTVIVSLISCYYMYCVYIVFSNLELCTVIFV